MILLHRSTRVPLRVAEGPWWTQSDRQSIDKVLRTVGRRMCRHCDRILPRTAFTPGGRGKCPPCHRVDVDQWRTSNPGAARALAIRRRARVRAQQVEGAQVTAAGLAAKLAYWASVCHLCRTKVDPDLFQWDHVKPIARGGLHILANLRPAHPGCNQVKSATWVTIRDRTPCNVGTAPLRHIRKGSR